MNDPLINDDVLFDRLVDGELSAIERRELLASLDDRPDGWRRCALAFLEAQSIRGEMRRLVDAAAHPATLSETLALAGATAPMSRWRRSRLACASLAMAASLLVAFGLGWEFKPATPGLDQVADSSDAAEVLPSGRAPGAGRGRRDAGRSQPRWSPAAH